MGWAAIREALSMLRRLDMSGGESSRGSGRCEEAHPGRLTGRCGHGWDAVSFGGGARGGWGWGQRLVKPSAASEKTDGAPECNAELCCGLSPEGGRSSSTVPGACCCNYISWRSLFLLLYFWSHWWCALGWGVRLLDAAQRFKKLSHHNQIVTSLCSNFSVCDPTWFALFIF